MENVVFLIDGHNLLYRAHFAFIRNPLINSKGVDTSVSYGFTAMLLNVLKKHDPKYLAVVFDRPEPTFRKLHYDDYKKQRPPMPDEIQKHIPIVHNIITCLGIKIFEEPGFEADDVLGTIALKLRNQSNKVIIFSGDKDLLQLIGDGVEVYLTKSGTTDYEACGPQQVMEKYGVEPAKMSDLIALMGDTADNIPGVPKVGPKTAATLLRDYGSVEQLLERLDQVSPVGLRDRLISAREDIILGKYLATINTEIPLDIEPSLLKRESINYELLTPLFQEMEFRQFLETLAPPTVAEQRTYHTVTEQSELAALVEQIQEARLMSFDVETTSVDAMRAELVGISISTKPNEAWYIPVGHATGEKQLALSLVLSTLKPLLLDETIAKVGHNIKYDWILCRRNGLDLRGVTHDTMVASYLQEPGRRQHNLDALCWDHLKIKKIPTSSLIGKKAIAETMDKVPIDKVSEYACEDADTTLRLYHIFKPIMEGQNYKFLFDEVEMPLVEVLVAMEMAGFKIDSERLHELALELRAELAKLTEAIYAEAGEEFNINSPKQLNEILFNKLHYSPKGLKKTTHGWSTDEESLHKLVFPGLTYRQFPELLLEHRGFTKLLTTYVEALPRLINPVTHRVHTSFNQTVAETGRLSSSDPNMQNIPIKGEWGRKIRAAFIPENPKWFLVSADYSQIELRVMAHISGDETMIELFRQGIDIHAATAQEIFSRPPDAITQELRRVAKTINFGIIYGMNEYGLSQRLGISIAEAKDFISRYFQRFPKIKDYIEETCRRAAQDGYVSTLLNRRRQIPEINDERRGIREAACRRAINMPIQGTAADLIKIAMIRIYRMLTSAHWKSRLLLQVHDELVFEVPPDELESMLPSIKSIMEGAMQLKAPLVVDIKAGKSWAEGH